jgi:Na+/H+ antiporter NhaD/arsenite permease-like protein
MNPVIGEFSHVTRLNLPTLAWALALGTDVGGGAALIGASSNVVEASLFCSRRNLFSEYYI